MAELLAAGTAVGIASSLVTFGDVALKVLKRLEEYSSRVEDVPRVIEDIMAQLPVLREKMAELKQKDADALAAAVRGCEEKIRVLDKLTVKMCRDKGDSKFKLIQRSISSVRHEKEVSKAWEELNRYKITIILYFTGTGAATKQPKTQRSAEPNFMVPFDRDPKFVSRGKIIAEIDQRLETRSRVALAGIGGIGKSQIAIEYCYRFRERHPEAHVLWVYASTITRFDQGYKDIARKLSLPGWDDGKINTLQLVYEWLTGGNTRRWLLVLDNADDTEIFFGSDSNTQRGEQTLRLASYLPIGSNGKIVITTRDTRLGKDLSIEEEPVVVPPMTMQEAETMMQSKIPRSKWCEAGSNRLIGDLECLPLAITQAAAFISRNNITITKYLEILHANDANVEDLLSKEFHDPRRDLETQNSVIRTWKLSFDQLNDQEPRAAEILSLIAILDQQGIPETFLRRDGESPTGFIAALGALKGFSLVTTEKGENLGIHRLVQLSTQKWLDLQGTLSEWQKEALSLLSEKFPIANYENWSICETLAPHVQLLLGYTLEDQDYTLQRATLLYKASRFDSQQGRYRVACLKGMQALETRDRVLGKEHPDTLRSMQNLALIYWRQGQWEQAENLQVQALDISKRKLGEEHIDTLAIMDNLALTYRAKCQWEKAEALQIQVLNISRRVLGDKHPETLRSMNNLALTYRDQSRWNQAEALQVQVLDIQMNKLGGEHPDTVASMSNLSLTYEDLGRWEKAEELQDKVLKIQKKIIGEEHSDTLTSMSNLSLIYQQRGREEQAEALQVQILDTRKRVLGEEHPDTLKSMCNLAMTYWKQNRWDQAEELQVQVTKISKRVLGEGHSDTLISMDNLALTYREQGKWEQAEALQVQTLDISKRVFGEEHLDTLRSMSNLALTHSDQGRWEQAEALQVQVLDIYKKTLKEEHPDLLMFMSNLALTYENQRKWDQAEVLYAQTLDMSKRLLGENDPATLRSTNNLAWAYRNQGRWEEAEALQARLLRTSKEVLGEDDPAVAEYAETYAAILEDMKTRNDGAEHPAAQLASGELPHHTPDPHGPPSPALHNTGHNMQPIAASTALAPPQHVAKLPVVPSLSSDHSHESHEPSGSRRGVRRPFAPFSALGGWLAIVVVVLVCMCGGLVVAGYCKVVWGMGLLGWCGGFCGGR